MAGSLPLAGLLSLCPVLHFGLVQGAANQHLDDDAPVQVQARKVGMVLKVLDESIQSIDELGVSAEGYLGHGPSLRDRSCHVKPFSKGVSQRQTLLDVHDGVTLGPLLPFDA